MTRRRRAPFVALTQLLQRRHPKLENATELVVAGRVVVDGASITNLNATVRSDASIRVLTPRRLRGELKLAAALDAFRLSVAGAVAVDIGAAAGGFTSELLDRGAARVYAVDVGFGQLAGRLRADDRVVNLERTNVASLDTDIVHEVVDLVTIDLSYLPVAEAMPSLRRLRLASDAALVLVALIKPTFELRAGSVVTDPQAVRTAIQLGAEAVEAAGWQPKACTVPAVTGAGGAVEAFVLARRGARQAPARRERAAR